MPDEAGDQDTYEELMTMEDKEIKFWNKVNKIPNNIDPEKWEEIRLDYIERMKIEREQGIIFEKEKLAEIFRHLELPELRKIAKGIGIPKEIFVIATTDEDDNFVSKKWDVVLCPIIDMFKYEKEAIERDNWYELMNNTSNERYEQWLEYKSQNRAVSVEIEESEFNNIDVLKSKINKIAEKVDSEPTEDDSIEDDDAEEYNQEELEPEIDNYIPELQRAEFDIELGNVEVDNITLMESIMNTQVDDEDEWNF